MPSGQSFNEAISVYVGESAHQSLNDDFPRVYYKLEGLEIGKEYIIQATTPAGDPNLTLYNEHEEQLDYNDDTFGTLNSTLVFTCNSNFYVALVKGWGSGYNFNMEFTLTESGAPSQPQNPDQPDEEYPEEDYPEQGESFDFPFDLFDGFTLTNTITPNFVYMYIRLNVEVGKTYKFRTTTYEGGDLYATLYDEYLGFVMQDDDTGGNSNPLLQFTAQYERYYIELRPYNPTGGSTIMFDALLEMIDDGSSGGGGGGGATPSEGTTLQTAIDLPVGIDGVQATITPVYSTKYFRLNLVEGNRYSLQTRSTSDLVGYLLDSSGFQMDYNDDGGEGYNPLIEFTATESVMYFKVVPYSSGNITFTALCYSQESGGGDPQPPITPPISTDPGDNPDFRLYIRYPYSDTFAFNMQRPYKYMASSYLWPGGEFAISIEGGDDAMKVISVINSNYETIASTIAMPGEAAYLSFVSPGPTVFMNMGVALENGGETTATIKFDEARNLPNPNEVPGDFLTPSTEKEFTTELSDNHTKKIYIKGLEANNNYRLQTIGNSSSAPTRISLYNSNDELIMSDEGSLNYGQSIIQRFTPELLGEGDPYILLENLTNDSTAHSRLIMQWMLPEYDYVPRGFQLSQTEVLLGDIGLTGYIQSIRANSNAEDPIRVWENLNPELIEVISAGDNINFKSKGVGTGIIRLSTQNGKYSYDITVRCEASPKSIVIPKTMVVVETGKTAQLEYNILPETADQKLRISSGSSSLFTIDENGLITGIKAGYGNAVIYSKSNSFVYKTVTVFVVDKLGEGQSIGDAFPIDANGETLTYTVNKQESKYFKLNVEPGKSYIIGTLLDSDFNDAYLYRWVGTSVYSVSNDRDSGISNSPLIKFTAKEGETYYLEFKTGFNTSQNEILNIALAEDTEQSRNISRIWFPQSEIKFNAIGITKVKLNIEPITASNVKIDWSVSDSTKIGFTKLNEQTVEISSKMEVDGTYQLYARTPDGRHSATLTAKAEVMPYRIDFKVGDSLSVNQVIDIVAEPYPKRVTNPEVLIYSSDETIIQVIDGKKIKALKPGTVTITAIATANGLTNTLKITVTIPLERIEVPEKMSMYIGEKRPIDITYFPESVTSRAVTFTSSRSAALRVSEDGIASALKEGTVTVTITGISDPKITAKIEIDIYKERKPGTYREEKMVIAGDQVVDKTTGNKIGEVENISSKVFLNGKRAATAQSKVIRSDGKPNTTLMSSWGVKSNGTSFVGNDDVDGEGNYIKIVAPEARGVTMKGYAYMGHDEFMDFDPNLPYDPDNPNTFPIKPEGPQYGVLRAIHNAEELFSIGKVDERPLNGNYYLANDIDFSAYSKFDSPVGTVDIPFRGSLDGRGRRFYNIHIESSYKVSGYSNFSIFNYARNCLIKDLVIEYPYYYISGDSTGWDSFNGFLINTGSYVELNNVSVTGIHEKASCTLLGNLSKSKFTDVIIRTLGEKYTITANKVDYSKSRMNIINQGENNIFKRCGMIGASVAAISKLTQIKAEFDQCAIVVTNEGREYPSYNPLQYVFTGPVNGVKMKNCFLYDVTRNLMTDVSVNLVGSTIDKNGVIIENSVGIVQSSGESSARTSYDTTFEEYVSISNLYLNDLGRDNRQGIIHIGTGIASREKYPTLDFVNTWSIKEGMSSPYLKWLEKYNLSLTLFNHGHINKETMVLDVEEGQVSLDNHFRFDLQYPQDALVINKFDMRHIRGGEIWVVGPGGGNNTERPFVRKVKSISGEILDIGESIPTSSTVVLSTNAEVGKYKLFMKFTKLTNGWVWDPEPVYSLDTWYLYDRQTITF